MTSLFYPDRSGMNDKNNFLSMITMRKEEPCEDKASEKVCQKYIKRCDDEKIKYYCKKTCGLCNVMIRWKNYTA